MVWRLELGASLVGLGLRLFRRWHRSGGGALTATAIYDKDHPEADLVFQAEDGLRFTAGPELRAQIAAAIDRDPPPDESGDR